MLDGVRILDLTWVLGGPFAGQTLAQLGADVIKVEPPEGDLSRSIPPYYFEGDSSFFLSVNRGKSGVSIDLKHPDGRETLYDLVRVCDAVVYGFAPDVPKRLGIDFDSLLAINPKIVVAELIGLDDKGPYSRAPAFDLIVQALSGIMHITGEESGKPVRVGYQIADLAGGLYLALATLGALLGAARRGRGQQVQVSLLDCQLALLTWQAENYFISGDEPSALGSRSPMISPSEAFPCADGRFLAISPTGQQFWCEFCKAIARPDLADDPRFSTPKARIANVAALAAELGSVFVTRSASDWAQHLFEARVPAARVQTVSEAVEHPLAASRGMVETVQHPASGAELRFLGNPFKFVGRTPLPYPARVGEHTRAVLRDLCGYSDSRISQLRDRKAIHTGDDA